MFRKSALALFAFGLTATAALADDITMEASAFMSTKTRAEVQAEVLKARQAGQLVVTEVDLSPTMPASRASSVTREQVRAEHSAAARARFLANYPA